MARVLPFAHNRRIPAQFEADARHLNSGPSDRITTWVSAFAGTTDEEGRSPCSYAAHSIMRFKAHRIHAIDFMHVDARNTSGAIHGELHAPVSVGGGADR